VKLSTEKELPSDLYRVYPYYSVAILSMDELARSWQKSRIVWFYKLECNSDYYATKLELGDTFIKANPLNMTENSWIKVFKQVNCHSKILCKKISIKHTSQMPYGSNNLCSATILSKSPV